MAKVIEFSTDLIPTRTRYRIRFIGVGVFAFLWTGITGGMQILAHRRTPTARTFHKWSGRWARGILRLAGIKVVLDDRANLSQRDPYIFVGNHQSGLDILSISTVLPYPFGYVAKAELRDFPLLGVAMRHSACVFVDKRDPRTAVRSIQEAGQRIREGNSVLIFPEGQRSYSTGLYPFQRGAFVLALEAGVPLVPVVVLDNHRCMDERRLLLKKGTVRVVVLPPISVEGLTRKDLPALMDRVRTELAQTLAAHHGVEDLAVLNLPPPNPADSRGLSPL